MEIEGRKIGSGEPVYFIAEVGGNFKTLKEGKKLIHECQKAGADAVKLQTFKAKTHISKHAKKQFEIVKKLELDEEMHYKIFDYCKKRKITVFSTPSHKEDVDFLEELGIPAFKVGSDDVTNTPFIKYVAKKMKPVVISTGMCYMNEVKNLVKTFFSAGNKKLALMHCVSVYPPQRTDINLKSIPLMKKTFTKIPVGYSDHTEEDVNRFTPTCVVAAFMGADLLEKHVILNKNVDRKLYPDANVSADMDELRFIIKNVRIANKILGENVKRPARGEMEERKTRRKSLFTSTKIPKGTIIKENMVCEKRPAIGLEPKYRNRVIGKKAKTDMEEDHIIRLNDLE